MASLARTLVILGSAVVTSLVASLMGAVTVTSVNDSLPKGETKSQDATAAGSPPSISTASNERQRSRDTLTKRVETFWWLELDVSNLDLGDADADCAAGHEAELKDFWRKLDSHPDGVDLAWKLYQVDAPWHMQFKLEAIGEADGYAWLRETGSTCMQYRGDLERYERDGITIPETPHTCNEVIAAVRGAQCLASVHEQLRPYLKLVPNSRLERTVSWETFTQKTGLHRSARVRIEVLYDVDPDHEGEFRAWVGAQGGTASES